MTKGQRRPQSSPFLVAAIIRVATYALLDLARLNLSPSPQIRRPALHSAPLSRRLPWFKPDPLPTQAAATPAMHQPLAHAIHDYPLQDIYAALYLLEAAPHQSEACLQQVRATLSRAAAQLRGLCSGLYPASESDPCLVSGLQKLVDAYATPQRVPAITFSVVGTPPIAVPATADILAIARGALVNALRHSRAEAIRLKLTVGDVGLNLEIGDDGIGFDAPADPCALLATQRYGLAHMAARAAMIGATLTLETAPGHGTCVRLGIPPANGAVWNKHPEHTPARNGGSGC